jgi:hypothetical protein
LHLRPGDLAAPNMRGFAHLKAGQVDKAVADFDAVLRSNPGSPGSLYGGGLARLKKREAAQGSADIAAAKAIKPDVEQEFARYKIR